MTKLISLIAAKKTAALVLLAAMLTAVMVTVPVPAAAATAEPVANQANKVVAFAKTMIGTPYKFGASGPRAFDCSSYTRYVLAKFGIKVPRTALAQSKTGTYVSKSNLSPGDLVFFKDTYKPGVSHVGIYIGSGKFIHNWPRTGVKISSLSERYFVKKWWGAKRMI